MIISHSQQFIFLANRKTASTSVGITFSSACNKRDVITPLGQDESIRRELGYLAPRNYIPLKNIPSYILLRLQRKLYGRNISDALKKIGLHTHITPTRTLNYLPQKTWDSYFKFCFVRNPWDLVISKYFWVIRNDPNPISLDAYINSSKIKSVAKRSREMYTINDDIALNRICIYENIQAEVNQIFEELSLPGEPKLPNAKRQFRSDHRHYRDVLNDNQADKIAKIFEKEIELAGHSY